MTAAEIKSAFELTKNTTYLAYGWIMWRLLQKF